MGTFLQLTMKLTVTLVTLLSLGTALANPGFVREDKPGFEEHCAACCMQPTTETPTDPTSTTMPATTCNPCLLNTTPSPASRATEATEVTTTGVEEQSCAQLFQEGCKCDNNGAAQHIVSLTVLAVLAFIAFLL